MWSVRKPGRIADKLFLLNFSSFTMARKGSKTEVYSDSEIYEDLDIGAEEKNITEAINDYLREKTELTKYSVSEKDIDVIMDRVRDIDPDFEDTPATREEIEMYLRRRF
ncbi:hypothetical protein A3B18_02250 [Candidatus Giovannonibacteria bacterium RIFCSPLOWO2_01_FULL_46_13]|uniref:Uncharacterized protein n=1 Tax=Candidatus Giovannonibacteria bacterium RIFCSPLOWO2_01_FULL_46_13 TaxID=1798352 RepID=A0A1F5X564_9BACT|nr:MAG: hypothetical protein A3B18_02250 [Candidatus Giovannonibacteria bacterium RIFCSPLOWO2_01_FULL_46_13]